MEAVLEMFNEDRIVRPHLPHVFAVPRLMTHMWRKQLSKDADVILTLPRNSSVWPACMHEPLIILIVFPLTYVERYYGPWVVKGTDAATAFEERITAGFRAWKLHRDDPSKLLELEGEVPEMWEDSAQWCGTLLLELLNEQRNFPPVHECLVRGLLHRQPARPLPPARFARRGRRFGARPVREERPSKRARR